jgi:Skp family chaperone for outer membrane proteins
MNAGFTRLATSLALLTLTGAGTAAAQAPSAPTGTQPASPARIAFVKARTVLTGMPGYSAAESTYARERQQAEGEAQRMQAVWDSTVKAYQQSEPMLSASQRTARQRTLSAQQDSLRAKLQGLDERMERRERELLSPMQTRLQAIIDGIRAESNFSFVIDLDNPASANIVSYDRSLDITDRVVRRLLQSN